MRNIISFRHSSVAKPKAVAAQFHSPVNQYQAGHHHNMAQIFIIKPGINGELVGMDKYCTYRQAKCQHDCTAPDMFEVPS